MTPYTIYLKTKYRFYIQKNLVDHLRTHVVTLSTNHRSMTGKPRIETGRDPLKVLLWKFRYLWGCIIFMGSLFDLHISKNGQIYITHSSGTYMYTGICILIHLTNVYHFLCICIWTAIYVLNNFCAKLLNLRSVKKYKKAISSWLHQRVPFPLYFF